MLRRPQQEPRPVELMDTAEIADLLRTTVSAIYGLKYRGEMPPAARVGRRLLWKRADIERWIERRIEEPPTPVAR
jgi:excisionase family DNA binding protein